jgi:hypothetical protein
MVMLRLGQKVVFVADCLEQNLPLGDYGYIIAYDRNADNIFEYVVRAPRLNKNFFVTGEDIELEETLLELEANRAATEALIDYALATHNAELFYSIMNGDDEAEPAAEKSKDVQTTQDFIKQVNLKAWI